MSPNFVMNLFEVIFLPGLFYATVFYHGIHGMPIYKWDIIVDCLQCIFFSLEDLEKNVFEKYK